MLQICRFYEPGIGVQLGAVREGEVYNLSSLGRSAFLSFDALLSFADQAGLAEAFNQLQAAIEGLSPSYQLEQLKRKPDAGLAHLLPPVDRQEVWAAGVTYLRSRDAREEESKGIGIYDRVYEADRPEIFFKATPHRVVGPNDTVFIRGDSRWNVPEPELTVVLTPQLQVFGFTAGNDVSSRDIEGANPLYIPQAKIFSRCCALGPAITLQPDFDVGQPAGIGLTIRRNQEAIFQGQTSTAQLKRTIPELVSFLGRHNTFPQGAFLMTGTGIVPPDDFTLDAGDVVEITVERIGQLVNDVAITTQ